MSSQSTHRPASATARGVSCCTWLGRYLDTARPVLIRDTDSGSGPQSAERRLRAGLPATAAALFVSHWGSDLWHDSVAHTLRPCLDAAGVPCARELACLREAAAVHLLEAGCDLRYLAALFGFRSLGSVQRYAAVSVALFKSVHARFHPAEQAGPTIPTEEHPEP